MSRALAILVSVACLAGAGALALAPEVRDAVGHVLQLLVVGDLTGVRDYLRGFDLWAPLVSVALTQVQAVIDSSAPRPSSGPTGSWPAMVLSPSSSAD